MTISDFIDRYQNLITVHFDFDRLAADSQIHIRESEKVLSEFLDFYVPRYSKARVWDSRNINEILNENESSLVKVKEVLSSPRDWGLPPFSNFDTITQNIWPVPLVTDTDSAKTLILDSNHTIITLLLSDPSVKVPCVELLGDQPSHLGVDVKLMLSRDVNI